jgi:hypothetical protein
MLGYLFQIIVILEKANKKNYRDKSKIIQLLNNKNKRKEK